MDHSTVGFGNKNVVSFYLWLMSYFSLSSVFSNEVSDVHFWSESRWVGVVVGRPRRPEDRGSCFRGPLRPRPLLSGPPSYRVLGSLQTDYRLSKKGFCVGVSRGPTLKSFPTQRGSRD